MSKYTIADVANIVPTDLTPTQIKGIEKYLNDGIIPPVDPCISCEPTFIRKLISLIQVAERNGYFPPKRTNEPVKASNWVEDSYTAGTPSNEELEAVKAKRPEMYTEEVSTTETKKKKSQPHTPKATTAVTSEVSVGDEPVNG